MKKQISGGVVHEVPADLRRALLADESALERWEDLTPLARNEWICWVITVKRPETRQNHIERVVTELLRASAAHAAGPAAPTVKQDWIIGV